MNYRFLKREYSMERDEDNEKKNNKYTTTVVSHNDVYVIYNDNSKKLACRDSSQIIDSDASYHVAHRRGLFSSYIIDDFEMVNVENQGVCEIVDK